MVGDGLRNEVWKSLLHLESLRRYYSFVARRLEFLRRCFALAAVTSASIAAGGLLSEGLLPREVAVGLTVLVAALTVWSELADYSNKSAKSSAVATDLGRLASEMRTLWARIDERPAEEVERDWQKLEQQAELTTGQLPADLFHYWRLQDKAEAEAYGYYAGTQSSVEVEA